MIVYRLELFGVHLLTRLHGSATYKATIPAAVSTSILLIGIYGFDNPIAGNDQDRILLNPYTIGVFISFFTYLITFRANFSYGRVSGVLRM